MFVTAALFVGTGCADIAELREHLPYTGFPDSLSARCSDGMKFVPCESVGDSAPQDGHTLIGRPAYHLSGNDVVDELTGLSWYSTPGPRGGQSEAKKYCESLDGNYRLPSRIELVTLLDFRANSPVRIDRDYFPNVKPIQYWTDTVYTMEHSSIWMVDFCGSCGNEFAVVHTYLSNPDVGVLCVKDSGEPYKPGPFEVSGPENQFLRDARTGLEWLTVRKQTNVAWKESLAACHEARDGSYTDLRMPNAKELQTLVDETAMDMNPSVIQGTDIKYNNIIWSSTPSQVEGEIFVLNATGGSIGRQPSGNTHLYTLCVRGPD
jgi:hypothetical protein